MRVACFTDTYVPEVNGVVTSIEAHSRLLAERGHEVLVVCPKYRRYTEAAVPGVRVERYPAMSFITNKATRVAVPSLVSVVTKLRRFSPDIVHIHTPLSIGVMGLLGARTLRLPNIQTYHTFIPDFMQYVELQRLLRLDRFSERVMDSIIIERMFESGLWQRILKAREPMEEAADDIVAEVHDIAEQVAESVGVDERPQLTTRFAWQYTRTLYNRSDLVLTPSDRLRRELVKHGITVPVEYLSNGIDTSLVTRKRSYAPTGRILHAGRLGHEKNVDVVIRAFASVAKRVPHATLDILGDGPARESIGRLAAKLGLADRVRLPGFVERTRLAARYHEYDCFVTASTIETQGIVLLEAMSAGLPVVGVDALAIPELVRDGRTGTIVPSGDDAAIADALTRMLTDDALRERYGKAGAADVTEHELGRVVDKLESLYAGVIRGRERAQLLLAEGNVRE